MNQCKNEIAVNIYTYARARGGELLSPSLQAKNIYFSQDFKIGEHSTGLIFIRWCLALALLFVVPVSALAENPSKKPGLKEKPFKQAMEDKSPAERLKAIEAFRIRRTGITKEEFQALRNSEKNGLVRHRLNQTMAEAGLSDGGKALIDSLKNDQDAIVRQGAAQSLGNYVQSAGVVQELAVALGKESDPAVRYACALSLGLSNTPVALSALEKAAADPDLNLRRQIAFSLKRHTGPRAKIILKKLKADKDLSVRLMAGAEK